MPSPIGAPQAFGMVLVALVLASYAVIALLRKRRFQSLSSRLGARFVETGLFAPGRVVGDGFAIEASVIGAGRYRRYRTIVQMAATRTTGAYLVKAAFFENFPDWRFVKALGTHSERVFVTTVTFPRYLDCTPEQRQGLLDCLGPRASVEAGQLHQALRRLRIRELSMENGLVTISFRGAVSNRDRIEGTLNVLRTRTQ